MLCMVANARSEFRASGDKTCAQVGTDVRWRDAPGAVEQGWLVVAFCGEGLHLGAGLDMSS